MLFSPQIPLKLEPSREQRFENFITGPNEAVVQSLSGMIGGTERQAFLFGPQSSGKTHLLNALCLAAREAGHTAFFAGLERLSPDAHGILDGIENVDLLCVDDLHAVSGREQWEEALFHAINRMRASGKQMILSARGNIDALDFQLPDLVSRLQWGLRLQLQPLGDEDKVRVLDLQARALGILLPEEVGHYLIRRSSRHLGELVRNVERLQQAAFVAKRRITVPLAREVLGVGNRKD